MFKIKTLGIDGFKSISKLSSECDELTLIEKNKFSALLQPLIPYNLRKIPSIHLAIKNSEILGFIILESSENPSKSWEIKHVYVNDEKGGVGEELIRYVLSVYGGYGVQHFLTEINSQNFNALSLFHECGFRRYAKVHFYKKSFETESGKDQGSSFLEDDLIVRKQQNNDLNEIQKLDLSSIPPDLRPGLGRSKQYFKEKKNAYVLKDKSRNIVIGWFYILKIDDYNYLIELLMSPGWTHLYERLLNTIVNECIDTEKHNIDVTVKVSDYITELTGTLSKLGFLSVEVRELLVRTIWQKVKEKSRTKIGIPSTAPIQP